MESAATLMKYRFARRRSCSNRPCRRHARRTRPSRSVTAAGGGLAGVERPPAAGGMWDGARLGEENDRVQLVLGGADAVRLVPFERVLGLRRLRRVVRRGAPSRHAVPRHPPRVEGVRNACAPAGGSHPAPRATAAAAGRCYSRTLLQIISRPTCSSTCSAILGGRRSSASLHLRRTGARRPRGREAAAGRCSAPDSLQPRSRVTRAGGGRQQAQV